MLEILAPAGNELCAEAAINSGADAIYLGLSAFSARQSAENFDEAAFRRLALTAHLDAHMNYFLLHLLKIFVVILFSKIYSLLGIRAQMQLFCKIYCLDDLYMSNIPKLFCMQVHKQVFVMSMGLFLQRNVDFPALF